MTTSPGPLTRRGDEPFWASYTLSPRLRRVLGPTVLVLGSLAFAVFSIRSLRGEGMLAFGDLQVLPNDASVLVDSFRQAWADRGYGGPFPSVPWVLYLGSLLTFTDDDAVLAQKLALTLWIPVAFCGMAYLCRRFLETSWFLASVGGIVYVATPISIGLVVGGSVGLIWSYALLPLVFVGAESLRRRNAASLAWFALPVALLAATAPELLAFGVLVAAVWLAVGSGRHAFFFVAGAALLVAAIASMPALVGRGEVPLSNRLIEQVTNDFEYTYRDVTAQNLLRFAGNNGDPMDDLGYNESPAWGWAGYLPIAAVVIGLVLRRRGDTLVLRLTALAAVAFGALLGIALLTRTRPEIFEEFTPSFVFRNPGKLTYLLAATLVPAAIYGLHRLFQLYPHRRQALTFIVAGGVVAYVGGYASPALSGDWGIEKVRGSSYVADDALLASARFVERQEPAPGRWRAVWLPFDHRSGVNLQWIHPYWANEPFVETRHPEVEDAIAYLDESVAERDIRGFHAIADRAAVRWVIVRASADPEIGRMFARDPRMTIARRGDGFIAWRNTAALPRIRQYSGLKVMVLPKARPPKRYTSRPILTLSSTALNERRPWPRGWSTSGFRGFRRDGNAIRVQATSAESFPVLARRFPSAGRATYLVTAQVKTRNADSAHLKVLWYRGAGDPDHRALDQDYAEPILNGRQRWTRVSGVVEGPRGARFGEVAFLAGKRRAGSSRPAVSWIRNLRVYNLFIDDPPPTATEAVADVAPLVAAPGYELVRSRDLRPTVVGTKGLAVDSVLVNPSAATRPPPTLRGGRTEVVSRAEVALRPRTGDWQTQADSAVVVSTVGTASLPLGILPRDRYVITLTGCSLATGSLQTVQRGRGRRLAVRGPRAGCGRYQTTQPVALRGRSALRMSLRRGASLESIHAFSARPARARPASSAIAVREADTPSPRVAGLSTRGLTLADSFHSGWDTSGSGGTQMRVFPGVNGFVVDDVGEVSGLNFGPQWRRDVLIAIGALGWLGIVALLLFGSRATRWLIGKPVTGRGAT